MLTTRQHSYGTVLKPLQGLWKGKKRTEKDLENIRRQIWGDRSN